MSLGSRMKERRESLGMTQVQLAELLGVTKGAIGNYETGANSPKASIMYKVFEVLKCDANYLFQDEMKELETDDFTVPEIKIIKKYRALDVRGKEVVDGVLNIEYKYTMEKQKEMIRQEEEETIIVLPLPLQGASAGTGQFADDEAAEDISVVYNSHTSKADYILRVSGDSMEPKFYDGDLVLVREQPAVELGEIGIFVIDGDQYIKEYRGDCLHSLNPEWEDVDCTEDTFCRGKVIGVLDEDWMR